MIRLIRCTGTLRHAVVDGERIVGRFGTEPAARRYAGEYAEKWAQAPGTRNPHAEHLRRSPWQGIRTPDPLLKLVRSRKD